MQEALGLLRSLPLTVDEPPSLVRSEAVLQLMRTYRLTSYDATYLELAARRALPLATKDRHLRVAAVAVGTIIYKPPLIS